MVVVVVEVVVMAVAVADAVALVVAVVVTAVINPGIGMGLCCYAELSARRFGRYKVVVLITQDVRNSCMYDTILITVFRYESRFKLVRNNTIRMYLRM